MQYIVIHNAIVYYTVINLLSREWSRFDHFRCKQGRCNYLITKWNLTDSKVCEVDGMTQKMEYLVKDCSAHFFPVSLHKLERDAVRLIT